MPMAMVGVSRSVWRRRERDGGPADLPPLQWQDGRARDPGEWRHEVRTTLLSSG
jgi:hypothetical protein